MPRSPQPVPMPRLAPAMLALVAGLLPCVAFATDIVVLDPPPLTRKFPENEFCPLPFFYTFVSPGTQVTIHVEANVNVDVSGTPTWARQALDNVLLTPTVLHHDNMVLNTEYDLCYVDAQLDSLLAFDRPELVGTPVHDLFDSNASGWDLTQGAFYYANTRSADRDPSNTSTPHDTTGGSLGLGEESQTPSLGEIARSSKTVTGLVAGASYTLSGWWYVGPDCIFTNQVSMDFQITAPESTPARRSPWGALKIRYR